MLFMLKANSQAARVQQRVLQRVSRTGVRGGAGPVKGGAIKGIWKVAGPPIILAVIDCAERDDLDHAIHALPIWKLGYAHIASDTEIWPLRPYLRLGGGSQGTVQGLSGEASPAGRRRRSCAVPAAAVTEAVSSGGRPPPRPANTRRNGEHGIHCSFAIRRDKASFAELYRKEIELAARR